MTNLESVNSSNIKAIGWEDNNLFVKYNSDKTYSYKGVSKELFEDFKKADSKGSFMNQHIKGKFDYKLEG